MIDDKTRQAIIDAVVTGVPKPLWEIFDELDRIINDANGGDGSLRSTQIISLVVLLWKRGIIKIEVQSETDHHLL